MPMTEFDNRAAEMRKWEPGFAEGYRIRLPIREIVVTSPRVEAWNLGVGEAAVLSHAFHYRNRREKLYEQF